jgi:hypothetical protein
MLVGTWLKSWGVASVGELGASTPATSPPANDRAFHVEYDASVDCPPVARFTEALLARSKRAEQVADLEQASIRFRVEARAEASTLWVTLDEGSSRREFSGTSCEDLVETMAVVAAMVVEAEPGSRLSGADRVARPEPVVARASESSLAPPSATAPTKAPVPAAPSATRSADSSTATPAPAMRWKLAASAGVITETATASTPPLGGVAGMELAFRPERGWGLTSRLEVLATLPATEQGSVGDAELRWIAGRASACGRWGMGVFALGPCLVLDVGQLSAKGAGDQVNNAQERTMPWLAGGAMLRLEYRLTRSAALEAALGARLLRRHDLFYLRPAAAVFQVPAASFGAQLGVNIAIF